MKLIPLRNTATSAGPRSAWGGFTLVEVMVALTVLSLIMLATVSALRTLGSTQATLQTMTGRVDEVRSVSNFLRGLLESLVVGAGKAGELSVGATTDSGMNTTYFNYGADFLEFKSTILFGEGYGGSYIVRLAQEDSKLVLRWQDPVPEEDLRPWSEMPFRTVVDQLEEYAVAATNEYEGEWSEEPDNKDPPALVRLRIKAAGRYWPDLVMRVQR